MNVLSLFDGCACALVALKRVGIKVENYFASEVDKYAIKIAQKNYPEIIQLGDVKTIDPAALPEIDLLIGGSPCTDLSLAGKMEGINGSQSSLFFDFVRLRDALNPKYFLLENVARMKKVDREVIDQTIGVEPIRINSSLVSAQMRDRLYWTNIQEIQQPQDKGILLKDILEYGVVGRDKSFCIDANYWKGTSPAHRAKHHVRQVVFDSIESENKFNDMVLKIKHIPHGYIQEKITDVNKYPTLAAQIPSSKHLISYDGINWRKLTPIECESLQTLEDNYTEGVSNTQRYKMLGNGFTVDVIAHILSYIKE